MWLLENRPTLTKDNMIKKNWHGDPSCYFCDQQEDINQLFFTCPVAKVIWGFIALCFGSMNRPISYQQFWPWVRKSLPGGDKIYMTGLAATCWAI